ncbi:MAG TPA: hypothetical protein VN855_00345 [Candidatus Acidoferrum sp.]|nr:hypothetical protein [Candidatus Acidoferrum sp.]
MNITPNEIDRVEEAGTLYDSPVKMVRTKGGFWIAIGKKKRHTSEEALAAGSHPAIVKYNLEKQYSEFRPAMMKSEGMIEPVVEKHSHFLSDDLRKGGYDIFSIQNGQLVEFQITKQNAQVATVNGSISNDHLLIESLSIPKEFVKALAGATLEKSISCEVGLRLKK